MADNLKDLFPRLKIRVGVRVVPERWIMYGPVDDRSFSSEPEEDADREDPRVVEVDAREIQQGFLSIETPEDALEFYRKTHVDGPSRFNEIEHLQKFLREAVRRKIEDWPKLSAHYPEEWVEALIEPPWVCVIWEKKQPVLQCDVSHWGSENIQHAIGSLLQLQALNGREPRVCDRTDCQVTFDYSQSRTDRRYCSRNCANVSHRKEIRDATSAKQPKRSKG